jgi:hypothetical protein
LRAEDPFWQPRYYDFNVWGEGMFVEKLRYIHRNPVERGLVAKPEDWEWSSFRHYMSGERGTVEIESHWTARRRERAGIFPTLRIRPDAKIPAQAKLGRGTLESQCAVGRPASPAMAHDVPRRRVEKRQAGDKDKQANDPTGKYFGRLLV